MTPAEQLRKHKREIDRAVRDLDRERTKLQMNEKKIIAEIRKAAQSNQQGAAKIMAKDLVRTRRHVTKFYQMKTHLQGVSLKLQTLKSNQAMADAMSGATRAMMSMNAQMNMPQLQAIMRQFEMQDQMLESKQEMMEDAMDGALDTEGDEDEEADQLVQQVFDEIGIDVGSDMAAVATDVPDAAGAEAADTSDLEARLAALRNG
eukprot:SAG22_NODE_1367_length_4592_cov_15.327436_2_plen_204_part_00